MREDRRNQMFHGAPEFRQQVENAQHFRGGPQQPGSSYDAWEDIARGNNLGKSVPISFLAAGFGGQLFTASAEVLRIASKGERQDIAKQVCLTIAPPQIVLAANAPNPVPASIQGSDALAMGAVGAVGGANGTGGFPVGPQSIADDFQFANSIVGVEWGIGAVKNKAFIDCANGLTINLVTSWIIVTAFIEQQIGLTPSPGVYIIGANVGPGTPQKNSAQRTIFCGFADAGAVTSTFSVPRFAKSVRVASGDGGAVPNLPVGTIQFFADPNKVVPMGDFAFNGNQTNPIPIPNGAYYFDIVSGWTPSAGHAGWSAIFDLNL